MSKEEVALELAKEHFRKWNGGPSVDEIVAVYQTILKKLSEVVVVLCLLFSVSNSQPNVGIVSAHWDIYKQAPIYSFVYQQPVAGGLFWNGFVEAWHNPAGDLAYPADKWIIQSKHWLALSFGKISLSTEIQVMYNLPDAWKRYPKTEYFQENRVYIMPKIGLQYRVW